MKKSVVIVAALGIGLSAALAQAQSYPSKPVRLIVPFPPGGTTDLVARIVQPKLSENLGQQVIVENRGGAGGSIAATETARSAPDGYTLQIAFDTHAVNQHLYKQAPDVFKTFEHISLMTTTPGILVASPAFAPSTLKDLIAAARSAPGTVTYGSVGTGSSNHFGSLLLSQQASVTMNHIPYKGAGPLVQAMLGSQVNIAVIASPAILPHAKSGKVKAIAVGGRQRLAQMPDVPTLAETYPGMELLSWIGLVAPTGMPRDVFGRIHKELLRTLAVPEVRQRLTEAGFDVVGSSPDEFLRFVQAESDKLGKLIRDNGIKVE